MLGTGAPGRAELCGAERHVGEGSQAFSYRVKEGVLIYLN